MASKRLTKKDRDVFVKAVMIDVPKPNEETCKKEFAELVYQAMPQKVQAVYIADPTWLESHSTYVAADSNTVGWDNYRDGSFYISYYWHDYRTDDFSSAMIEYLAKLEKIMTDRIQLKLKIAGIAEGCTTVAQLKEALPDLAKYAPDDVLPAKKNLPVVANLMAEVVALGWPGGKIINAQVMQGAAA